jgi:hypothetical protein
VNLQDRAMLATLTIHQWTNRKHDKSVSTEVEKTHGAKDAGRYNKQLVDKVALEPISKIANAARTYHYERTLPWGDNGDRLLPASLFMDYTDSMRQYKSEFEKRVHEFVAAYPVLVQAARNRLGTMYDALDYPAVSEIALRFGIETAFTPVPAANDFRVQLNDEYVETIRIEIEQRTLDRQAQAMKDCWSRVRDVVSKIHERLSDKDAVFRDTLIGNARELVAVLPHLNIAGDPALSQIESEVKDLLVAPETLRADSGKRAEIAARAADILNRFPRV